MGLNKAQQEQLLKIKDHIEFLGEVIPIAHREIIFDEDWQIDARTQAYALDCLIYFVGEENFDRARSLAHDEADRMFPDDDDKNSEYYGQLLQNFITSLKDALPKEHSSRKLAWRRS